MPTLRIALVITELEVGGAEQCLVRLATGLDRSRFVPVVYSLAPLPLPGRDPLVVALRDARIEVHSLNAASGWQFLPALRKLTALLRIQQPHVLQSFLFHANVLGFYAAQRAKTPRVLLGIRVADPSWWRGAVERSLARRASGVVCVSQAVAEFARVRHRLPAERLLVIPNGLDVESAAKTPAADLSALGVAAGRKALAFIGRLQRQKDPLWLVQIARDLLPRLPNHELLIVGDGDQREALAAAIRSLPVSDRVHMTGWRPDALSILAASEMLLLTSRHEGLPNVILEAMALGKPVVATRAEGVLELLGAAADEQTVDWGDSAAFAAKVALLAGDAAARERLAAANLARAQADFSLPAMIAAYERLFAGDGPAEA